MTTLVDWGVNIWGAWLAYTPGHFSYCTPLLSYSTMIFVSINLVMLSTFMLVLLGALFYLLVRKRAPATVGVPSKMIGGGGSVGAGPPEQALGSAGLAPGSSSGPAGSSQSSAMYGAAPYTSGGGRYGITERLERFADPYRYGYGAGAGAGPGAVPDQHSEQNMDLGPGIAYYPSGGMGVPGDSSGRDGIPGSRVVPGTGGGYGSVDSGRGSG